MSDLAKNSIEQCYQQIKETIEAARSHAYRAANLAMVQAYWSVGRHIVEEEQNGKERADYGTYLLGELSERLTKHFGKGFNERNLRYFRQFYLEFPIRNSLRSELRWTHYRMLMKVTRQEAREFYIKECIENDWNTRQLERQINSFYYERLLSSQNKDVVRQETQTEESKLKPEDVIKDPFVLEFLNLKENKDFLEKDLESALIGTLQDFLLELGKGFAFVARQQRITMDNDHFYIDLVFYNYLLKCFVLIDLKKEKLTHQDIGQMDMYVRLYEEKMKPEGDNPTIGLILCSEKNEAVAKYSVLNESKQLFASKYQMFLPTEEELARELEREIQEFELKQEKLNQ